MPLSAGEKIGPSEILAPIGGSRIGGARMAEYKAQPLSGPDFKAGTKFSELTDNEPLLGRFDGEYAILVRQGDQVFATGAVCTH
jgi:hypothetical protein